ncbi:MAG: histidine kinase dimerization/phospho-acceptor domain-containing protein, partial [Candidatus Kapaibacterium sp.]
MDTIRVLLIDDDEDDYLITRDLLAEIEGQSFDLKWVDGGDEGLAMLKAGDYDVCLLDYRLGPGTGLELMSAAHKQGVHVPFILMTGMSDRAIDLQAMSAGAADYLIKGQINAALLERSIRYSIQQHRMIEALRLSEERLGEALRMSESRFRRLSDSNMIGIIVGSLGGPISEANDAFLSMAGYSCADLEAGALQWTAMTPEEYQAADADALREIASHGASRPYEKEYLRKDGTRVQVLMGLALLEGSSDTFIAFVLDLVEQKRIERELHAASKAKDHFLAVLSHELRTPLTPVLSLVQVLEEDESLADDTREFVDIIRRNVELEARLIDDLLDLTRVIQGKLMLQLAEIDVEHVIRQVLDI